METRNDNVVTLLRGRLGFTLLSVWWCFQCAVRGFGQNVIAWGDNSQGQCNVPSEATNVIAVAAGLYHSLALRADGTVVGWGSTNAVPGGLNGVTSIAAGLNHCLALRSDGTVVAWGDNSHDQTTVPPDATNVVAISAGNNFNLALRADGTVVGWGRERWYTTVNIPAGLSNVIAVAAGTSGGYFLRNDRKVVTAPTWLEPYQTHFSSVQEIVSICTVDELALALTARGEIIDRRPKAWTVPATATNMVALAARTNYVIGLRADGDIIVWGKLGVTNVPPDATNIVGIAAGMYHALAVRGDGQAPSLQGGAVYRDWAAAGDLLPLSTRAVGAQPLHYEWFADGLAVPNTDTPFPRLPAIPGTREYQLVVGNAFGAVTSAVATVTVLPVNVWGDNHNDQRTIPKAASNLVAVAAGEGHCVALTANGQVLAWGKNRDGQTSVPPATTSNIVAVAAGSAHNLALKTDGSLVAWGRNWDGQTNIPAEATDVVAISAGWAHNLALRRDGAVVAWGNNDYGQTNTALLPTDFIAVAAGYFHSAALRSDGTVVTWGWSVPTPAVATNIVALAAGWEHCVALRADGSVIAWGDNSYGQSRVPANATNVVAIAAGYYHNVALRADGSVLAWGAGACGVTNLPVALGSVVDIEASGDNSMALVGQGSPWFRRQPLGAAAAVGATMVLSAELTGAYPLSFQWYRDGVPLPGATNRFLVLPGVQPANAGTYTLAVSSPGGQAISQPATLSIRSGPNIAIVPQQRHVAPGHNLCFSPAVVGAEPLSFHWQHLGTNLADTGRIIGTSSKALCVTAAEYGDNGSYSLVAENAYGAVTNAVAEVTVTPVLGWGDNSAGQLEVPATATNVVAVAAGATHSIALRADGSLIPWGDDTFGQNETPAPATNLLALAEGQAHSVALRADGKVFCWGDNSFGQTNVPAAATNVAAIAAGSLHTLALRSDGSVIAWGCTNNGRTTVPSSAINVIAIAATDSGSFALKNDGTIVRWGRGPTAPLENFVDIAGGDNHLVALRPNGSVAVTGANYFGQAEVPGGVTNIVAIAAGGDHSLARSGSGEVWAWGANYSGEGEGPVDATNLLAVAAGDAHNLALVPEPEPRGAPRIAQQPLSGAVFHGGTFVLRAGASGSLPLNYQWYFNSTPVAGQTRSQMAMQDVQSDKAGNYEVVVANTLGAVTSRVANVAILPAPGSPVIVWQPMSLTAATGEKVTCYISVGGASPFYCQWQKDGLNLTNGNRISGATSNQFWINDVRIEDAGFYRLIVTNYAGKAATEPILLTVSAPVAPTMIDQPPAQLSIPAGTNLSLAVTAVGTAPLAYQWRFNQTNLAGRTSSLITLANVSLSDSGDYNVVVTNLYGAATSAVSRVSVVVTPPYISSPTQSVSRVLSVGQYVTFTVDAVGAMLSCQWRRDGVVIPGATDFSLALRDLKGTDSGQYEAIVTNPAGSAPATFYLTVVPVLAWGARAIEMPASVSNAVGIATGVAWDGVPCLALRADGTLISWSAGAPGVPQVGPTTNIIGLAVGGIAMANTFYVAVDRAGKVAAWGANPGAQVPPELTNVIAVAAGGFHALGLLENGRVVAWGQDDFGQTRVPPEATNVVALAAGSYHSLALSADGHVLAWGDNRFGQSEVPAEATNILMIAATGSNNVALRGDGKVIGWSVEANGWEVAPTNVTNVAAIGTGNQFGLAIGADGAFFAWGTNYSGTLASPVTTNVPMLAIVGGDRHGLALARDFSTPFVPQLGQKPSNRSAVAGDSFMLYASTVGSQKVQFQWYLNETPLTLETNRWLSFSNVQPDQAGNYRVVISNAFGATTSSVATVSLTVPSPEILGRIQSPQLLQLSFYAFRGVEYAIEWTEHLDAPTWQEVSSRFGRGAVELVPVSLSGSGNRFYRLRIK